MKMRQTSVDISILLTAKEGKRSEGYVTDRMFAHYFTAILSQIRLVDIPAGFSLKTPPPRI